LFLHWAEIYDWVSSLPPNEKPIASIIEDDELFDAWYKKYAKQQEKKHKDALRGGNSGSASSHSNVMQF
jgi:hypothetical protein